MQQHCSSSEKLVQKDQNSKTEMEIARILTASPPIVENIFKHLTARDLCSSAQVCTLWQSMAYIEKKRRKNLVWFCKVGLTYDYSAPSHVTHSTTSTISERLEFDHCWELRQNRVEPAFCMAFASTQLIENFPELFPSFKYDVPAETNRNRPVEHFRKRKYLQAVIKTALQPYLKADCPVSLVISPGIVGCCQEKRPVEVEDGPALSGFLFPKLPGVEIHHFPVTGHKYNVSEVLPEGTTIKCLLVFLTSRGMALSDRLVQSCFLKENCRLAVGGSIVERTESPSGSVIAICGDNVEAASVIIGPQDKEAEITAKLEKFREAGLLEGRCFAYMFACVGRGHHLYRKHNVESSLFHRLYPLVPLVGTFGNGEIGITYFPHLPSMHRILQIGKFKRSIKKYLHSYTTVFVMVSIKD